jgi:hypothetical protein
MNNLKASLFLYSIVSVFLGVALWFVPGSTAEFLGISSEASGFIFALLGAANVAVAYLFVMAGFRPLDNMGGVRFAILWSALMIIASLYAILADYVTWGHIWFVIVIHGIFFLSMMIFYPWRSRAE